MGVACTTIHNSTHGHVAGDIDRSQLTCMDQQARNLLFKHSYKHTHTQPYMGPNTGNTTRYTTRARTVSYLSWLRLCEQRDTTSQQAPSRVAAPHHTQPHTQHTASHTQTYYPRPTLAPHLPDPHWHPHPSLLKPITQHPTPTSHALSCIAPSHRLRPHLQHTTPQIQP